MEKFSYKLIFELKIIVEDVNEKQMIWLNFYLVDKKDGTNKRKFNFLYFSWIEFEFIIWKWVKEKEIRFSAFICMVV